MEEKNTTFHYTYDYSAKQQAEIKKIRERYIPRQENKMEQLHRLDESVKKPGKITAIIMGIISALLLGVGMCCCMVWMGQFFIPGIIIGMVGLAGAVAAYPLYSCITRKRRKKVSAEILALTDELIK